jgi:hypothetical protein
VSEGAARHSTVAGLVARDPEGGLVTYSILAGNQQDHFSIEESTGVVRVNQPLDREDTRLYTLVSFHMKSSLKGTRAEGVQGGCQYQPAPGQGGHQALHSRKFPSEI